jgi:hypothetical protein
MPPYDADTQRPGRAAPSVLDLLRLLTRERIR